MTQKRQNKNKTPEHCILHIKKFGKIDEAQIELFPLTFFIGDNNSGKSYIMSLIYGLQLVTFSGFYRQNSKFIILPRNKIDQESKIIARELFSDILSSMKINDIDLMKTKKNIIITRQIFDYISSLINNTIKKDKDLLINNIFNAAVPIEDISIEFPYSDDMKISVSITNDFLSNSQIKEEPERDYLIEFYFSGSKNPTNSFYFPENLAKTQGIENILVDMTLDIFYGASMGITSQKQVFFLPSSRTGFMLSYRNIVGSIIKSDKYSQIKSTEKHIPDDEIKGLLFTKPTIDFLQFLATVDIKTSHDKFKSVIELLQNKIIEGEIAPSDSPLPEFLYHPTCGCDQQLPMFLSSGVVTEMAPLILTLKYAIPQMIFIEEPEISLHPYLQFLIARALIQIHAQCTALFVSTHSDTIIQHINNMIKLTAINDQKEKLELAKKYGYSSTDFLPVENVTMYEFKVNHQSLRTTVTKLKAGEFGFGVPSFNNAYDRILEQSRAFENEE